MLASRLYEVKCGVTTEEKKKTNLAERKRLSPRATETFSRNTTTTNNNKRTTGSFFFVFSLQRLFVSSTPQREETWIHYALFHICHKKQNVQYAISQRPPIAVTSGTHLRLKGARVTIEIQQKHAHKKFNKISFHPRKDYAADNRKMHDQRANERLVKGNAPFPLLSLFCNHLALVFFYYVSSISFPQKKTICGENLLHHRGNGALLLSKLKRAAITNNSKR
eukprot:gene5752-4113_t